MFIRIAPDKDQPSAAIEIPLAKPLPDYDLHQLEQPTPRDVDAVLVSQGFRDLARASNSPSSPAPSAPATMKLIAPACGSSFVTRIPRTAANFRLNRERVSPLPPKSS